ncbi:sulfate adenylyltransferase, partial [Patescibacteria group bacterium]|nr:sulfate adenylyltransferase [Patescibacteria group bacterium]
MTTAINTRLVNLAIKTENLSLYRDRIATLRRINLTPRQLCDLEMLIDGSFSPLTGFLSVDDYNSVVQTMRLTNGCLWPMPVTFDVREKNFSPGEEILLCDKYGGPLAILAVSSIYEPDKLREAKEVYGTIDKAHPGVRYLLEETGNIYLGGQILGLASPANHSFTDLRQTPQQLQDWFVANGWDKIIGFQTRNPIHRAHYELIRRSAEDYMAKVLIHPVVGETKPGDIDYVTRVRCYRKISDLYTRDFAKLSLLPLAMRMAGPREALWHALIRKNYSCTHFIVGRNHADPGPGSDGQPLYGAYDAQDLTKQYESEIGLTIIPQSEIAYVPSEKKYLFAAELQPQHQTLSISGTELRRLIRAGEEVPDWLSFPEVVSELRLTAQRELKRGITIFMTGLSGSGKSSITKIVQDKLTAIQDREITVLDGDVIRQNLSKGLGFSREDRDTNILR